VFTPGGEQRYWTFPLGDKVHPWGPSSSLGANHVVKNGPSRSFWPVAILENVFKRVFEKKRSDMKGVDFTTWLMAEKYFLPPVF
jgi:hypothetical protein